MRNGIKSMVLVLLSLMLFSCGNRLVRRVSDRHQGGVHGLVYWKNRSYPLKKTRVTVVRQKPSAGKEHALRTTDTGEFVLLGLPAGEYTIKAHLEGSNNYTQYLRVTVHDGEVTSALFPIMTGSFPEWHPDHWRNPLYPAGLPLKVVSEIPLSGNPYRQNLESFRRLLASRPGSKMEKRWFEGMKRNGSLPLVLSRHHAVIVADSPEPVLIRNSRSGYKRVSLLRRPGSRLWFFIVRMKQDALLEYKLTTIKDEWLIDPANPCRLRIGDMGGDNSRLVMPGLTNYDLYRRHAAIPHGRLVTHVFTNAVEKTRFERKVHVYLPPGYETGAVRYRTVYMLDGQMHNAVMITNVLDNLIACRQIPPCIVVMPEMNRINSGMRYMEYAAPAILNPERRKERARVARYLMEKRQFPAWINDLPALHNRFVARTLVTFIDARFRTRRDPADRIIAGQSFGGIAAMYIGTRPDSPFGGIACQSQSGFIVPELPGYKRVYLSFGNWESADPAREMGELRALFSGKAGYILKTNIFSGAHAPVYWEMELGPMITFLFSGKK